MKFAGKEFPYYWKIIKIPLAILVGWSLLGLIIAIIDFNLYTTIFSNISGWIITIAIFGFIGYHTKKDFKGENKNAFWAGGLTGIIQGFIGAIIAIIMINLVPDFLAATLSQATASGGADPAIIEKAIKIGLYVGLRTGPLFSGIIGGFISWIGGLISKKA